MRIATTPCVCRGLRVCAQGWVSCVSMSVCRRLSSSGTHPRSFGLLSSILANFLLGPKRRRKLPHLILWLRAPGQDIQKSKSSVCVAVGRCTERVFLERCSRFLLIVETLRPDHLLRTSLESCLVLGREIRVCWELCQFSVHPVCRPVCLNAAKGPALS